MKNMDLRPFDIIVFRKKTLIQSIYSAVTLDLDNHVGIVIKYKETLYLNHFIITNFYRLILNVFFNFHHKCGKPVLTPIEHIHNDEYYIYRFHTPDDGDGDGDDDLDTSRGGIHRFYNDDAKVEMIMEKAQKLNYLSDFPTIINFLCSRKIFPRNVLPNDGHTCISYVLWYLNECNLYDTDHIQHDFYQKKMQDFQGPKYTYMLLYGHNVGKKDLSKFNPYRIAYIISFALNILQIYRMEIKNKYGEIIPRTSTIFHLALLTVTGSVSGRHSHQLYLKNGTGRRYIGFVVMHICCAIVLLEYNLQIEKQYMQNIVYLIGCPRIFFTRFASWLCNDVGGLIDDNTKRPYDTALYEALFEGLLPTMFLLYNPSWMSYKWKNLIISLEYSITRFFIEFYKPSMLDRSKITLGQVDSLLNVILVYWYLWFHENEENFALYLLEYSFLYIYYLDVCYRFTRNHFDSTYHIGSLMKLQWRTTRNKGFYNGAFRRHSRIFKFMYPMLFLYVLNKYIIGAWTSIGYIFNIFSLLNIFERSVNGYVTDYFQIHFLHFCTFNLNFADLMINFMMFYFFCLYFINDENSS